MPVYTWDKGDRQCHRAPPCDSMDVYGRAHVSVSLLLQQARQRGPAKGWKVVFVSRSRPHTVLHSLVPLGVFSHWQMPVWQSGPCSCCWGPQSSLTRGGARLLKNQQQWRNKLPSACLHLSSEKDVLISKSSLQEAQWISSVKSPRFSPHWFKALSPKCSIWRGSSTSRKMTRQTGLARVNSCVCASVPFPKSL